MQLPRLQLVSLLGSLSVLTVGKQELCELRSRVRQQRRGGAHDASGVWGGGVDLGEVAHSTQQLAGLPEALQQALLA